MMVEMEYRGPSLREGEPVWVRRLRLTGWVVMGASLAVIVVVWVMRPGNLHMWTVGAIGCGIVGYMLRVSAVVTYSVAKILDAGAWRKRK